MKKCLSLEFFMEAFPAGFDKKLLRKARLLEVEGYLRVKHDGQTRLELYGDKDQVDCFVVFVEGLLDEQTLNTFMVEPHTKNRDFRGVFRVIL
ncbi:hypothetical protein HOL34_03775 [bacterium]|jgi:hypothetical protein|nr:hypothetical protein [bacterium]MBT3903648.1 hypothetical protein [bacterium]MBT4577694.1 hypothetical protein [bacterium]MBT5345529.1 hypothetical protein [bacterium]MBT6131320.1 hypothetical protein [bacterium]